MVKNVGKFSRLLLTRVPATVEARLKEAIEKVAEELVAKMKRQAPTYAGPEITRSDGSPIRPGALRDSIGWTWGTEAPKGSMKIASAGGKFGEHGYSVTIYAGNKEAFYARWVEHGTKQWGGKPFFYGNWRNMRQKVKGRLTRALRKAIKELNTT